MTKEYTPPNDILLDSCVLIDFLKVDRSILELVVKYICPVYIIAPVIDEVNEIDNENELIDIGINIIEPEIEDAYLASKQEGSLSFIDWMCLFTSKRHSYICVTNDKRLRTVCKQKNISVMWGLELVLNLHSAGGILAKDAENFAKSINKINPKHINNNVLSIFKEKLRTKHNNSKNL